MLAGPSMLCELLLAPCWLHSCLPPLAASSLSLAFLSNLLLVFPAAKQAQLQSGERTCGWSQLLKSGLWRSPICLDASK